MQAAREREAAARRQDVEKALAELERFRLQATIERDDLEHRARAGREERDVELFGKRRAAENELSEAHVKALLIERLPEVAQALPKPRELRSISVGGDGAASLTGLLAQLLQVVEGAVAHSGRNGKGGGGPGASATGG
jgi:hypothetical protein